MSKLYHTTFAGDGAAGLHRGAGVHPLLPPVLRGPAAHPGRAGRDGQEVRQPAPYNRCDNYIVSIPGRGNLFFDMKTF